MKDNFLKFYSIATIFLGSFVGVLFALPIASSSTDSLAWLFVPFFGVMGGLAGYRRRHSKAFFYLSLVAAITLITIIYFNMIQNEL